MNIVVLCKDSEGNKPYRYTQIMAILTTPYTVKLITKMNKVHSIDKDLIVDMHITEVDK